jgi:F-type H+-transporting ATPase subunit delta
VNGGGVAGVYAQALFEAAGEAGEVERAGRELGDFVAALAASAPLRAAMEDPQVDTAAKKRVVAELTRDAHPLVANTLQLLLDRGRLGLVDGVNREYDALAAAGADRVTVEVTSAVELTPETRQKIAARLGEGSGRTIELLERVDPAIVGGLVLRRGDVIVDGSVRARIRQLRRRLATAELER